MSRVGKKPIPIPAGVEVKVEGNTVRVKGPKGQLERQVHPDMEVRVEDGHIVVRRPSDERQHRALHGLTRTLVANMVEGVTKGYEKALELVGTGYRAAKTGNKLTLTVGFSHPVEITPPAGIQIEVPRPTEIRISGMDKELVGQFAADVRSVRPPEPYLGKGIRYVGEKVRRKVGKTGKK
ncbi:50S ribosomal protein L6 [Caldinitratiruptor microaerophilus]|uniref:Large ribosomal subunit protein uL6 n=1 Tax=Caldinitratiruptor microaerophilus TaxID=671077 RepID=A0AA35CMV4_9FIRM|nr:50S ribosomal protein L6 [Caldinitratiruptor microaerophilus]BDG62235.1 50S ribosomal protein L6 [Caldinitratiruptor microaerophilus]